MVDPRYTPSKYELSWSVTCSTNHITSLSPSGPAEKPSSDTFTEAISLRLS